MAEYNGMINNSLITINNIGTRGNDKQTYETLLPNSLNPNGMFFSGEIIKENKPMGSREIRTYMAHRLYEYTQKESPSGQTIPPRQEPLEISWKRSIFER